MQEISLENSTKKKTRYYHSFNLNEQQNSQFLQSFKDSKFRVKSHFIIACLFNTKVDIVFIDKCKLDYYMRLTSLYTQFRELREINHLNHQVLSQKLSTKELLLYSQKTHESYEALSGLCRQIIEITQEFESKHL